MLDKTLALVAVVVLILFVSVLVVFVKSPSLIIVVTLGVCFALYDLVSSTFGKKDGR